MREATSPKKKNIFREYSLKNIAVNNQAAIHNTCRTKGIISEVSDPNGVHD